MFMDISTNVKQDLLNFLPISLHNDIRCFAFHDRHPCDQINIDLTICTARGEVLQLFQKEITCSASLNTAVEPSNITHFRKTNGELVYLVKAGDELLLLAGDLKCVQRLGDVEKYEINDSNFTGESTLKVWTTDDAVPTVFNNDLQVVHCFTQLKETQTISAPVETKLDSMVVQARYNLAHNEKALQDLKTLRQEAAFKYYESLHSNLCKATQHKDVDEMISIMKMKTQSQWIKVCNRKIVIALTVAQEDDSAFEDIQILLHTTGNPAITYTTKLYDSVETGPYWCELRVQSLAHNNTLVVVIPLEELKYDALSRIQLKGVVSYKEDVVEKILPLETVTLSAIDIMGGDYDAFSNKILDKQSLLAILATSQANDLFLFDISQNSTEQKSYSEAFFLHLNMEKVCDNVLVHRVSPYHELYGVAIVFHEYNLCGGEGIIKVTVYSRSDAQLLSLVHCIYSAIPDRLVVLPSDIDCTSSDPDIARQLRVLRNTDEANITPLVDCLHAQMTSLLQHYDRCMMRMNESTDDNVINKIGVEIDIFACGKERFRELKEELRKCAERGIEALAFEENTENSACMIIDSQE